MIIRFLLISCMTAAVLLTTAPASAQSRFPDSRFRLLPLPQQIKPAGGEAVPAGQLTSVYINVPDSLPVLPDIVSLLPLTQRPGTGTISLLLQKGVPASSPEGYRLTVKNRQVTIESATQAGLFYGLQTLNQLLEDARDQRISIPAVRITDFPAIPVRAVHIDLKNHSDAGFYLYHVIDKLAALKINTVIIELEDKLRYRKAAVVGSGDALSVEEFAALSRYAKDRFVGISPLVQGLGHASFILKHDEYKHLRDDSASDWAFDPMNPETYDLQFSLYEDAIAATPFGKYLHVGGDEVGKLGVSALAKASGKTPIELQMYWLKKVTDFATAHHRIPVFWDDMVFKLASLYRTTYDSTIPAGEVDRLWAANRPRLDSNISLFPANCIYMRWNYEAPAIHGNHLAIEWYKANHLPVMPATSAQMHFMMMQRDESHFLSIKDYCRITAQYKLDGILCTTWDDSAPLFETVWRGLANFAWFSWNAGDAPAGQVLGSFRQRFYSPALAPDRYEFQNMLEECVNFWDTALVVNQDRENHHDSLNLVELPGRDSRQTWTKTYNARLKKADSVLNMYREVKRRIDAAKLLAVRNRYTLEVMEQINEVQGYSSRLLLLLRDYDQATGDEAKRKALRKISDCEKGFSILRANMERVYGKVRFLNRPEGYRLSMNLHEHFAESTFNTDWMYSYELAMNGKVRSWLRTNGSE